MHANGIYMHEKDISMNENFAQIFSWMRIPFMKNFGAKLPISCMKMSFLVLLVQGTFRTCIAAKLWPASCKWWKKPEY